VNLLCEPPYFISFFMNILGDALVDLLSSLNFGEITWVKLVVDPLSSWNFGEIT